MTLFRILTPTLNSSTFQEENKTRKRLPSDHSRVLLDSRLQETFQYGPLSHICSCGDHKQIVLTEEKNPIIPTAKVPIAPTTSTDYMDAWVCVCVFRRAAAKKARALLYFPFFRRRLVGNTSRAAASGRVYATCGLCVIERRVEHTVSLSANPALSRLLCVTRAPVGALERLRGASVDRCPRGKTIAKFRKWYTQPVILAHIRTIMAQLW